MDAAEAEAAARPAVAEELPDFAAQFGEDADGEDNFSADAKVPEPDPTDASQATSVDDKIEAAASLLGVHVTANEDQIRAALRARLSSSRIHPDHGGDGDEAKRLIAAKNLLVDRARASRS